MSEQIDVSQTEVKTEPYDILDQVDTLLCDPFQCVAEQSCKPEIEDPDYIEKKEFTESLEDGCVASTAESGQLDGSPARDCKENITLFPEASYQATQTQDIPHSQSGQEMGLWQSGSSQSSELSESSGNSAVKQLSGTLDYKKSSSFMGSPIPSSLNPVVILNPLVIKPTEPDTISGLSGGKLPVIPGNKQRMSPNRRLLDSEIMTLVFNEKVKASFLQCKKCCKLFNKKSTLRQHYITHTKRFACPYCSTCSKSRGDLMRHIQTHTKEKPYHCDVCDINYTRSNILRKHMTTQLHLKALQEQRDRERIQSFKDKKETLTQEVKSVSINKTNRNTLILKCSECPKLVTSLAMLRKHRRWHSLKYHCDVCQKGSASQKLLEVHKRTHQKSTRLSCKVCSRSFGNFVRLREHIKFHKLKSGKKVLGLHQGVISLEKDKRPSRERQHSESLNLPDNNLFGVFKRHKCHKCNKTFTNKQYLKRRHVCSQNDVDTYVCGVCEQTFFTLSKLKIHLKIHEILIKCDFCDAVFGKNDSKRLHVLEQHKDQQQDLEIHKESPLVMVVQKHMCALCHKQCGSELDLRKHIKEHAPTMLFSGKSFQTDSDHLGNKGSVLKAADASKEIRPRKMQDSDDDSLLGSNEFYEILNNALEKSEDDIIVSELSESDDEVYSNIKASLEEVLSSDQSILEDQKDLLLKKPLIYDFSDIVKSHKYAFDCCSEINADTKTFKCKLCEFDFSQEKYLVNHLKQHVCAYCNIFFNDRESLAAHKSKHTRELLTRIKDEATRLRVPKTKWKGYWMDPSDSEDQDERVTSFLKEAEDKDERLLSHEEIVQSNKHIFHKHSYIDADKEIFACVICNKNFVRSTTLTRHFKTHVCAYCNQFFEDKHDLLEHKFSHGHLHPGKGTSSAREDSEMRPFPLASKPNRLLFSKFSYIDKELNIFRCKLCCRDYVRRNVLTRHLKSHVCTHCDKFFEDKYELAQHFFYYKGNKPCEEDVSTDGTEILEEELEEQKPEIKEWNVESVGEELKDSKEMKPKTVLLPLPMSSTSGQPPNLPVSAATSLSFKLNRQEMDVSKPIIENILNNAATVLPHQPQPVNMYRNTGRDTVLIASSSFQSCQQEESPRVKLAMSDQQENPSYSHAQNHQESSVRYMDPDHPENLTSSKYIVSDQQPVPLIHVMSLSKPIIENILTNAATVLPSKYMACEKQPGPLIHVVSLHQGHSPATKTKSDQRDRPYVCGECGKKFLRNNHLLSHMTIHTGERPFQCDMCDKSFSRGTILRKHIETHKSYCTICKRSFDSDDELTRHNDWLHTFTVVKKKPA